MHRPCRRAPNCRPWRNIPHHAALRRYSSARSDRQVAGKSRLPADHNKILYFGAPRNTHLADDDAAATDFDVMRELNKIVDLAPRANRRIRSRSPVNRCVRANLDIMPDKDTPQLRHFQVAGLIRRKAKPILANADTGVDDYPFADKTTLKCYVRADVGAVTDFNTGADDSVRSDPDPLADPYSRPDNRARFDRCIGRHRGSFRHVSPLSDPRGRNRPGIKSGRRHSVRMIRLFSN